jgi:enoyl-CoA hydratase/carnithine racemase
MEDGGFRWPRRVTDEAAALGLKVDFASVHYYPNTPLLGLDFPEARRPVLMGATRTRPGSACEDRGVAADEKPDMAHFSTLEVSVDAGGVGWLTLSRPERRNALSHRALEELVLAASWFDARGDVSVVVVSGEGRSFCGGFDVLDPGPIPGDGTIETSIDVGRVAMNAVSSMRAITIARLHGRVRGGGFVLALACDLRVIADDATLSLPEARLGMPIPWGALPRLVRELGPMRAKQLTLACSELDGPKAVDVGIAVASVPATELDDAVTTLVDELSGTPRLVTQEVKREIERISEDIASTTDGSGDVSRMTAAFADEGCRDARRDYLARWNG